MQSNSRSVSVSVQFSDKVVDPCCATENRCHRCRSGLRRRGRSKPREFSQEPLPLRALGLLVTPFPTVTTVTTERFHPPLIMMLVPPISLSFPAVCSFPCLCIFLSPFLSLCSFPCRVLFRTKIHANQLQILSHLNLSRSSTDRCNFHWRFLRK